MFYKKMRVIISLCFLFPATSNIHVMDTKKVLLPIDPPSSPYASIAIGEPGVITITQDKKDPSSLTNQKVIKQIHTNHSTNIEITHFCGDNNTALMNVFYRWRATNYIMYVVIKNSNNSQEDQHIFVWPGDQIEWSNSKEVETHSEPHHEIKKDLNNFIETQYPYFAITINKGDKNVLCPLHKCAQAIQIAQERNPFVGLSVHVTRKHCLEQCPFLGCTRKLGEPLHISDHLPTKNSALTNDDDPYQEYEEYDSYSKDQISKWRIKKQQPKKKKK